MGGPGSGSWYRYNSRSTVEDYRELTMRHLAPALASVLAGEVERYPVPIAWYRGSEKTASILVIAEKLRDRWPALRLVYSTSRYGGEKEHHDYHVLATSTPSNLPGNAGRRWWFICPLVVNGRACGRRVAKLYGGALFGCRHCHNLSYRSCNESHQLERMARSLAGSLAAELGDISADEVAAELRSWADPETLRLMHLTNQVTQQSKRLERLYRKMGLE